MSEKFEKLLAYHCAPALCGIKASNLINVSKKDFPDVLNNIRELNKTKEVSCYILSSDERKNLVLIVCKKKLKETLKNKENVEYLKMLGYPKGLKRKLVYLKERINTSKTFPHEIGIFLDYPLEDIKGFLNNERCLFTGYWKVYSNVDEKIEYFKKCNECKNNLLNNLKSGKRLIIN